MITDYWIPTWSMILRAQRSGFDVDHFWMLDNLVEDVSSCGVRLGMIRSTAVWIICTMPRYNLWAATYSITAEKMPWQSKTPGDGDVRILGADY